MLAVALAALLTTVAHAAPQCGPYEAIIKQLADKYHEQPTGHGLTAEGRVIVILFTSKDGKTWTIVNAMPSAHIACMGGDGADWQAVASPPPGSPM